MVGFKYHFGIEIKVKKIIIWSSHRTCIIIIRLCCEEIWEENGLLGATKELRLSAGHKPPCQSDLEGRGVGGHSIGGATIAINNPLRYICIYTAWTFNHRELHLRQSSLTSRLFQP